MKNWKKFAALCLSVALLAGCAPKTPDPTPTPEPTPTPTAEPTPTPTAAEPFEVKVSMLKGTTGLGAAKMMERAQENKGQGNFDFTFSVLAEPTEAVAALTKGEVDIAALPTNLASTLYHKLDGGIQLLALNTLGVLYILENGDSVKSMADLRGKTIHAFGQGANPEFVLNYLLDKNGLKAGQDVTVQWYSSTDEVSALIASGDAELAMLPVPAATAAQIQSKGSARFALDLNQEWERAEGEGLFTMGCVVARSEFVSTHPQAVETFLEEYGASIGFMSDEANLEEAAQLAETYGIIPKAAIAQKALPDANLCFLTGDDMMAGIQGYYQVLYAADPASIGGSIPDGAFYYQGWDADQ